MASGDLHLGEHFRAFAQFDSGLTELRDGGPRPGIDEDQADINQAFLDLTPYRDESNSVTLRAGRQLVSLGSTRLVAIGAGLNVEQPFDGFRLTADLGKWNVQGLALRPTLIRSGIFDNAPNSAEELWGVYVTRNLQSEPKVNLDFYYLGYDHKQVRYTQGAGREQRETIGARLWSHTDTWDYDFEYTGQFGRFSTGNIRAFGVGYHAGYTFTQKKFAPHPELNGGVLSGDHNPNDKTLGTFNPLFPNGNYLGQSILLGPYNLIIVRPTLKFQFSNALSSNTNGEFLMRQSLRDGVYNIVGILTHPPNGSGERMIGSQIQQEWNYQFTRHLSATLLYEHFFAGAFLRQSPPGHALNFVSPQLVYNF